MDGGGDTIRNKDMAGKLKWSAQGKQPWGRIRYTCSLAWRRELLRSAVRSSCCAQALEDNQVPLPSDEAGVAVYEYLYTQSYIASRLATPSFNFSDSEVRAGQHASCGPRLDLH